MICRLLPYIVADGPHNMAADEVLLETAVSGAASLRFYGWTNPTLSLGYFQPVRPRQEDGRLAELPFVRRLSGGLTLVHHQEVTYALGLPAGKPWQIEESWLCRMHRIIRDALVQLGLPMQSHACGQETGPSPVLCFLKPTNGDLLIGSAKVVGSAQRRYRGALLQHGAILLAGSPFTPSLPGILELTGSDLQAADLCQAVATEFASRTTVRLVASDWTDAEARRLDELAVGKYSQDWWNRKR